MRQIVIGLVSLGCASTAAFWGCGDQPEAPTGPTSGPSSSNTGTGGVASMGAGGSGTGGSRAASTGTGGSGTGGSRAASTGTGGSGTGGSGTGGSPDTLNGCQEATATDLTGQTTATIAFGGTLGLVYNPPCIKVKSGTMVTFNGDFSDHPLQGGVATSSTETPAASGTTPLPTTTPMDIGTTATFTMQPAGAYGFYCQFHVSFGMQGAIFVE